MLKMLHILGAAALITLGIFQSAQAYTWQNLEYEFSGPVNPQRTTSFNFTGDWLRGGHNAYTKWAVDENGFIDTANTQSAFKLTKSSLGWGASVFSPNNFGAALDEATENDRLGGGEALAITLNQNDWDIRLQSITLETFYTNTVGGDANQAYEIYVKALNSNNFVKYLEGTVDASASNTHTLDLTQGALPGTQSPNCLAGGTLAPPPCGIEGSVFVVVSLNSGAGDQGFKLKAFGASALVPLPPSAAFLGGALLVGGFVARRRRKAAQ